MTVIRPNSISGVSSITGSGGDISIFRADGTAADLIVNNVTTGIITATSFVGNVTGAVTGSGANLTSIPAAQLTGTVADARLSTVSSSKLSGALPALDGSALTGVGVGTADSINTSGIITATMFVSDTPLTHRNLLINGEMKINQRVQTGSLGYYNPVTSSIYTLDRWKISLGGGFDTDSAKIYHSTTAPTSEGFTKSLKVDIGNTETPSSGQRANIGQRIEGQDLQHLRYGTSSAKTMTLSFWVYSNKTGIYSVQIVQENKKYVLYEYTISSADTWEKKTITIVGNTADTIDNDNGVGFYVDWFLCANSDVSVSPTSSWTSGSSYRASTNQVNLWDNANNYWYLTGCQLELGPVVTPFEHRSFADELARCQRYYYRQSSEHQYMRYDCSGQCPSANGAQFVFSLPVKMRAVPTIGYSQLSDFYIYASNLQAKTPTNITLSAGSTKSPMLSFDKSSTFSAGAGAHLTVPNSNQGYIEFKAEL